MNEINIELKPKIKFVKFNEVKINLIDLNPPTKLEKKRYMYPQTTSSF